MGGLTARMHELSLGDPATRAELPPLTRRRTYVSNLGELHARPSAPTAAGSSAVEAATVYRTETHAAAKLLGLSADRLSSMSSAAEARALQMTHAIMTDESPYRLRPHDSGELLAICRLLAAELEAAAPANTLANERSNWKHWEAWCEHMGTQPLRNDMAANTGADQAGYEREVILLAAGLAFILQRMRKRPGWSTPPSPLSALQVLR